MDVVPHAQQRAILAAAVVIGLACPSAARARWITEADYLSVIGDMVADHAPQSARAGALIRDVYEPYVDPLLLDDFNQIEQGLGTGGLVALPPDLQRFNLRVRLDGNNPIGEKDLAHQTSYVSARAATIGCLLDVASRVKSGPLEVTSLVRHLDYQHQLRQTNPNAATEIPMHALGLAFDIAMVNTPLETVLEIRDVLQKMSDAGDIFLIVERQQLVFHVVPQPSRLGWYSEVYAHAVAGQPWARAFDNRRPLTPIVTTEIGSFRPLPAWAAAWWAAENVPTDLPVTVRLHDGSAADPGPLAVMGRYLSLIGDLVSTTWHLSWPRTIVTATKGAG
jgi:Family of unknown function (DUF5715)